MRRGRRRLAGGETCDRAGVRHAQLGAAGDRRSDAQEAATAAAAPGVRGPERGKRRRFCAWFRYQTNEDATQEEAVRMNPRMGGGGL